MSNQTPRIYFDITLSRRRCGKPPDGILRVERKLAHHVLADKSVAASFCRFDRKKGRLLAVSDGTANFILTSEGVGATADAGGLAATVSHLIRRARSRLVRWDLLRAVPLVQRSRERRAARMGEGDVYVMVGMPWDSHDFEKLLALKKARGFQVVVLLHDLLAIMFPQDFEDKDLPRRYRRFVEGTLKTADRVACISESTKNDLVRFAREMNAALPELCVTPLGSDIERPAASAAPKNSPALRPGEFVFTVANSCPRKNVELLYDVWCRLADRRSGKLPKLAVSGDIRFGANELLRKIEADPRTRDNIVLVGRVSDRELDWLYRNSLFTVYPSIYEGWGLPVAESLAYGKYCVASSASSIPEVTQGLVNHIDPRDLDSWYGEITRLIDEPGELARLEREIDSRYRPVNWREAGEKFLTQVCAAPVKHDSV